MTLRTPPPPTATPHCVQVSLTRNSSGNPFFAFTDCAQAVHTLNFSFLMCLVLTGHKNSSPPSISKLFVMTYIYPPGYKEPVFTLLATKNLNLYLLSWLKITYIYSSGYKELIFTFLATRNLYLLKWLLNIT